MNLVQAIDIFGGGVGSGCHGDRCGRHPEGTQLSERAQRAIASHKPFDARKEQMATRCEQHVAKLLGGTALTDHQPFDVLIGKKIGVEVKSIYSKDVNPKLTQHPEGRRRKEAYAEANKLRKMVTIAMDVSGGWQKRIIYYKEGVGAFRLSSMSRLSESELRKAVVGR